MNQNRRSGRGQTLYRNKLRNEVFTAIYCTEQWGKTQPEHAHAVEQLLPSNEVPGIFIVLTCTILEAQHLVVESGREAEPELRLMWENRL